MKKVITYILMVVLVASVSFAANKTMEELDAISTIAPSSDLLLIRDVSEETTNTIIVDDLLGAINVNAWGGLAAAVSAIGSTEMAVCITDEQALTADLTTPTTLTVKIVHGGSISGAYTLTINGPFEGCDGCFSDTAGGGNIAFSAGHIIEADWFPNTVAGMLMMRESLDTAQTGTINFSPGTTYNTGHATAEILFFDNYDDLIINGNGATLSVSSSAGINTSYGIRIRDCNRVRIKNLSIDGNRDLVDDSGAGTDGRGHGIFTESGEDIVIDNVYAYNMRTDGIYIGEGLSGSGAIKNVTVKNCKLEAARRTGLTVIFADDVLLDNNYYLNNGNDVGESVGIAGQTAIDLEPNGTDTNTDITISNSRFTGSVDDHIEIAGSTSTQSDIKIVNNRFDLVADKYSIKTGAIINGLKISGNTFYGQGFSTAGTAVFTGLKIRNNDFKTATAIRLENINMSDVQVSDNAFYFVDVSKVGVYCTITGGDMQEVIFSDNTYYFGGDSVAADYVVVQYHDCLIKDETYIRASGVSNSYRVKFYSQYCRAQNLNVYGGNIELYDNTIGYGFDNIIRVAATGRIEWRGDTVPLSGTFQKGSRLYCLTPASGNKAGVVCTTAGTPGTWKYYGAID